MHPLPSERWCYLEHAVSSLPRSNGITSTMEAYCQCSFCHEHKCAGIHTGTSRYCLCCAEHRHPFFLSQSAEVEAATGGGHPNKEGPSWGAGERSTGALSWSARQTHPAAAGDSGAAGRAVSSARTTPSG